MSIKKLISMFIALIVCSCALTLAAQDQAQPQPEKVIKHVAAKATSPVSGKEMYTTYCAFAMEPTAKARVRRPAR